MKSKKIILIIIIIIIDLMVNLLVVNLQLIKMNGTSELINDVGRIRGGIQRSVKLEFSELPNQDTIQYVDNRIQTVLNSIENINDPLLISEINNTSNAWSELKINLGTYKDAPTEELKNKIIDQSESLWELTDFAVTNAQTYQEKNINTGKYLIYLILFNLLLGLILLQIIRKYVRDELEFFANFDYLTKIYNRKFFMNYLEIETQKAERKNRELAMIMLDIDNFKQVNDTFGHSEGDRVLKEVSQIIKANVRKSDIAARYGGEEFIILLSETDNQGAYVVAEKVRKAVEEHDFKIDQITISLGISCYLREKSIDTFISHADDAMYQAKKSGKNNSVIYENLLLN